MTVGKARFSFKCRDRSVAGLGRFVVGSFLVAALAFSNPSAQQNSAQTKPMEIIQVPIAKGPVESTWKSLGDHFKVPTWWRLAKIGI